MERWSKTITIEKSIFDSIAYSELKTHSLKVLSWFWLKRRMVPTGKDRRGNQIWKINNNGELTFTYKEAETKRGMSRKQFANALDDLIAKGFLEVTKQGTGPGDPSLYRLSERWKAYGTENFSPAPARRKNINTKMGWYLFNEREKQNPGVKKNTRTSVERDTGSQGKAK